MWNRATRQVRQQIIRKRLVPGCIVWLHCSFTRPPKDKFLVLGSLDPPLWLIINSRVHPFIVKKAALASCQVTIDKKEHQFLNHDSFIDCTGVHRVAMDEVYSQVEQDFKRLKGNVSDEVKVQILAAVKAGLTLTKQEQEAIIRALS
jgi:hypothetical protein